MLQMLQNKNDLGAKPHVNCRIVDYPYDWIFEPCRRSNLKLTSFSVSVTVYEIAVFRPESRKEARHLPANTRQLSVYEIPKAVSDWIPTKCRFVLFERIVQADHTSC